MLSTSFPNGLTTFFLAESPYTKAISDGILTLQEKGFLQKLKNKWWKEMYGGGECQVRTLTDNAVATVFSLLVCLESRVSPKKCTVESYKGQQLPMTLTL